MYLEAVAMVPQIYMFQKQAADEGGTVEVNSPFFNYVSKYFISIYLGINGSLCLRFKFCKSL
jgi:hypothetical protein